MHSPHARPLVTAALQLRGSEFRMVNITDLCRGEPAVGELQAGGDGSGTYTAALLERRAAEEIKAMQHYDAPVSLRDIRTALEDARVGLPDQLVTHHEHTRSTW